MISTELDKIIFNEAIRKVHEAYGIYGQFTIEGNTADNFMLVPRTDVGMDSTDMEYLRDDIDFLSEQIKANCEQE